MLNCEISAMGSVVLTVCAVATFTAIEIDPAELWTMLRPVALAAALASVVYLPKACKDNPKPVLIISVVAFVGIVSILQLSYSAQRMAQEDDGKAGPYALQNQHLHLANAILQVLVLISLCVVLQNLGKV